MDNLSFEELLNMNCFSDDEEEQRKAADLLEKNYCCEIHCPDMDNRQEELGDHKNSVKGADASAVIYSIVETAKLNQLNIYYYLDYLLEQLPELTDKEGAISPENLEPLLPWSDRLPERCHKKSI